MKTSIPTTSPASAILRMSLKRLVTLGASSAATGPSEPVRHRAIVMASRYRFIPSSQVVERAVSAAARSARRRLDAVVRRLTLGHSCVAGGLTDSCGSFGTSRIYDHDSPALRNQVEDATGHRFPSIWRDSLRVHRWKLVHDKASIVALVEPLLECRFVAGLL